MNVFTCVRISCVPKDCHQADQGVGQREGGGGYGKRTICECVYNYQQNLSHVKLQRMYFYL